jgi:hypothetical protein
MAFSKSKVIVQISIDELEVISTRTDTIVKEDGDEVARRSFRSMYEPGDDMSAAPNKVVKIATALWTPAVISAYAAMKAAQTP